MSHWAGCVAISRGVTYNAGPVASHNTGFEPRFWALQGLQVLKLLYIVYFSALVANLANVAMCHAGCPVATIQNATVYVPHGFILFLHHNKFIHLYKTHLLKLHYIYICIYNKM